MNARVPISQPLSFGCSLTPRISDSPFIVIGEVMPPRDPNDEDEDEDENDDNKEDREPPVVREPDEE
jgi:hypothetical protein